VMQPCAVTHLGKNLLAFVKTEWWQFLFVGYYRFN
jgi:hypothetical protein